MRQSAPARLPPYTFHSYPKRAVTNSEHDSAWRVIPTTYMICLGDRPDIVEGARQLVQSMKASNPNKIDSVIEFDAGHFPFIAKPQLTAETLVREADRLVLES
jgi:pimeloyl-ACP methyl ester carboxylesterase